MSKEFIKWLKLHNSENLQEFNTNSEAQLWLKVKSIIRKDILSDFLSKNSIKLSQNTLTKSFVELFDILKTNPEKSHRLLDSFIKESNKNILSSLDQQKLVSELYKLKVFQWGGDYQNSLDKYLISHYVKKITNFDVLISKFETEINSVVQGYVLNSWYNHWSSILIEHIFKSHSTVLPTVGQIKGVDFFINNIPFDLKVTYFPSEYLKKKRKESGLPVELTFLKAKAKELSIPYDKNAKDSDIYYEIAEKMKDKGTKEASEVLEGIRLENKKIITNTISNSRDLIKWLYENQGEMRFGSENRIFLVLIDNDDFSGSWKLKRNLDLLTPAIHSFLNKFKNVNLSNLLVEYNYPGKPNSFKSLSDIIFITK
ncbi:hypothetical protein LEP1GSC195_3642 [Leptospira wolbachii serovar Codice str. CDC]|uniref:Uncharacterized protein n=1 Tax=Leptospira wolbachii serovar Codice str. CDC TaxID=1218599 RepID=R9A0R5_9LEPT|nr:hypothetical protein [Leptospira wolbachii]EOQ95773.1 hypothetical protein LEP1GSC195_3642 [Leptospira wolbachii serovar Codice str. CDC]